MSMMKGFDTTQALELYRQDVRQAARRIASMLLTDDELSKMKIGELHEALDLATAYIDVASSQISIKQIAEFTDSIEDGDLRMNSRQLSSLRHFYEI